MIYLNTYSAVDCYGGPEEGGWWYATYEPIASVPFDGDREDAFKEARSLNSYYHEVEKANRFGRTYHMGYSEHDGANPDGHGDDSYLIPGGAWGYERTVVKVEERFAEYHPKERPYYE